MNKIIIFDMDGVLFDTIPYAKKVFLERHPGVTDEMYSQIHAGNFHTEAAKYKHLKITETEEEAQKFKNSYAEAKQKAIMFEGMKELIGELHTAGNILVLNTNAYSRNCLPLLTNAGVNQLFDFIADADVSKDKVEKFDLIKKKYGENVVFVTDALGDVKDAFEAKVPTIAVTWGVHGSDYFDIEKYTNILKVVDTVDELGSMLKD